LREKEREALQASDGSTATDPHTPSTDTPSFFPPSLSVERILHFWHRSGQSIQSVKFWDGESEERGRHTHTHRERERERERNRERERERARFDRQTVRFNGYKVVQDERGGSVHMNSC